MIEASETDYRFLERLERSSSEPDAFWNGLVSYCRQRCTEFQSHEIHASINESIANLQRQLSDLLTHDPIPQNVNCLYFAVQELLEARAPDVQLSLIGGLLEDGGWIEDLVPCYSPQQPPYLSDGLLSWAIRAADSNRSCLQFLSYTLVLGTAVLLVKYSAPSDLRRQQLAVYVGFPGGDEIKIS